jgi:aminoglycoside phosphotransferase (APT) family kinase protein
MARVVRDAFGEEAFGEVEPLSGGRSGAATFSVTVGGARYVVRRGGPGSEPSILSLQMASERGVAPRLVHSDHAGGVTIMERIDGTPVRLNNEHPEHIAAVARTLRLLHSGPMFPRTVNLDEVIGNMNGAVRATGNGGLRPELVEALSETTRVTARSAGTAPCHNDLNPGNLLMAEGRVYFVDWDTAANHDPFFDLAEIGVFGCPSPSGRARLLHEYLGRAPTEEEAAHAVVSRAGALGFYSAAFSMVSAIKGFFDADARGLPMAEVLSTFAWASATPAVVAASLFAEMQREMATDGYDGAKRQLG